MQYFKIKKPMAFLLTLMLVLTVASTGMISSAADETTSTAQPGEPPSGGSPGGTPPSGEPPSGDVLNGPPGEPPSEQNSQGSAPTGEAPTGEPPSGGMGGANTMTYDYNGTYSGALVADGTAVVSDNETYNASDTDQNATLVQNAGTLTISDDTFTKSGDDTNGDNCNFYGVNSILLAVNSDSTAYLSGSTLSADSEGSNGIFATDNATVYANNNEIATTAGNSRGLDATYGGNIIANLMKISTQGDHSASIATDRGGGAISVASTTLSTAGSGSPLLYSTGDIEVDNVTGTASGSQIAGMEGLNTILIYNSTLTSTNTGKTASDPMADGIIIYQSTSGDAESTTGETATFEASDSVLKSAIQEGTMFYLTNTKANIVLSNTILDFDSSKANLLTVQGNDSNNWGTAGSNGAEVQFTGLGETLNGNIDVDTISSLKMYLLNGTTYTGAVTISTNEVNTDVSPEPVAMNLDSTSKWIMTGNSTVTILNAEPGSSIVDEDGNNVTIIANGETVVEGTSDYTLTVTGNYSTTVKTDDSNQLSTSFIDRTAFDEYYGIETTFGTNGVSEITNQTDEDAAEDSNLAIYGVLAAIAIALAGGGTVIYQRRRKI